MISKNNSVIINNAEDQSLESAVDKKVKVRTILYNKNIILSKPTTLKRKTNQSCLTSLEASVKAICSSSSEPPDYHEQPIPYHYVTAKGH